MQANEKIALEIDAKELPKQPCMSVSPSHPHGRLKARRQPETQSISRARRGIQFLLYLKPWAELKLFRRVLIWSPDLLSPGRGSPKE